MKTREPRRRPAAEAEEEQIAAYLLQHPDFFERHLALLAGMRVPHVRGSGTLSLIERQISVLREAQGVLERKLAERVQASHTHELLAQKLHALTRRLMRARSRREAIACVEAGLREDFDAVHPVLLVIGEYPDLTAQRFVRQLRAEDASLKTFESLFASGRPRCGQPRDAQRELLFGPKAKEVGSAALLPLGTRGSLGLLALGAAERDRFHPGMATDSLARVAELVTDALAAPDAALTTYGRGVRSSFRPARPRRGRGAAWAALIPRNLPVHTMDVSPPT